MKKIMIAGLLLSVAVLGRAQTMDAALEMSDYNYYGTARSMALGNAMVAIGGDLGSIGLNPAGSAVAGYSQFTFSPGYTSIGSQTSFKAPETTARFTADRKYGKMILPNVGITMNFDMGGKSGMKNMTFGFVANTTSDYAGRFGIFGENYSTSMFGALAQLANGYPYQDFEEETSNYWDLTSAFQSYLIDLLKGYDDMYIGATENKYVRPNGDIDIELADGIGQNYDRRRLGYKTDMVMNFAMNFSDALYAGVNLGIPIYESYDEFTFTETPLKEGLFQTGFQEGVYNEYTSRSGGGIYAKLGVIWRPIGGLRLGVTYQTPTALSVTEYYGYYGKSTLYDDETGRYKTREYTSPEGEYNYTLTTPGFFSVGAAYTLPFGFVSADFDRTDYRTMRYSSYDRYYTGSYDEVNAKIRSEAGIATAIRLGAEARISPEFSLRAGYNRRDYRTAQDNAVRSAYSAGLGYSSSDSFFFDLALRWNKYPRTMNYPYDVYDDSWALIYESPVYEMVKKNLDLVLTFGWRF